ncbi:MAG: succinate dehydrogenase / fumarate reductase, flavoprotein subunit, partial [Chloroflexia bacterium]|nr:succinate dehydrogenase / fumarate reductase, flavoprotein subunit [Chloroflexia bacterium]
EVARQQDIYNQLVSASGKENPYSLWLEMGSMMTDNVTVVRYNNELQETDNRLQDLMERYRNIGIPDKSGWSNQSLLFARQLWNMLVLSRVITLGALRRDESRGAHYKPDFPNRDDERFLKTTVARFMGPTAAPELTYEDVDIQYIKPRPRRYDVSKGEGTPAAAAQKPPEAASAVATATPGTNGHSGDGAKAAGATVARVEKIRLTMYDRRGTME